VGLTREAVARALDAFERETPVATGPPPPGVRAAAVAITLVTGDDGEAAFLLTRRSGSLRTHTGQWALPGGRIDGDESPVDAALRELDEELAVRADAADVVGLLDDYVTRSGFRITPVVLWLADRAVEPVPNEAEVASLHVIPVVDLAVPPRLLTIEESPRPVIQLPIAGTFVHAPTAAVLHQFGEVVLHGRPTRVSGYEQPVFAWR
jgi:8-oxo-dGTP pyrophosphatase MutT (NUDIX family)